MINHKTYQYKISLAEWRSYLTIVHNDLNADSLNLDKASIVARCEYITCRSYNMKFILTEPMVYINSQPPTCIDLRSGSRRRARINCCSE